MLKLEKLQIFLFFRKYWNVVALIMGIKSILHSVQLYGKAAQKIPMCQYLFDLRIFTLLLYTTHYCKCAHYFYA